MFRRLVSSLCLGVVCLNLCGCAVMMAAKAPDKKDLRVLTPGVSRSKLVAELGSPLQSREEAHGAVDVFAFTQGYRPMTKASRVIGHLSADVMTLASWEFVGTPLEAAFQGEDVQVEVAYDAASRVERVEFFQGAHLANNRPTLAPWLRGKNMRQTAVVGRRSGTEIIQASGTLNE
jgi:hypothetical protein